MDEREGAQDAVIDREFSDEEGQKLSERELRELAAFADGSLDARRREELGRRIERSPALASLLADQLHALEAVGASAVPAPASLRSALGEAAGPRRRPSLAHGRARLIPAGAFAAAVAGLAVALAIVLPGGSGAPSAAQAATLADRGIAQAAPKQDASDRQMLASAVDGLHYPYWEDFGWHASGARVDRLASHSTVTVFYADRSNRSLAYTIVGGTSLPVPSGAQAALWHGTRFAIFRAGGRTAVTWTRHGHTCVVSAVGIPVQAMIRLAAWHGSGGALASWQSQDA